MNNLRIEFTLHELEDEIDGLSRGHMTIKGEYGMHSSMNQTPDQSMMIFLAISELLDGIRYLVNHPTREQYKFIGMDCSFSFTVKKKKNQILIIKKSDEIISKTDQSDFIKVLFEEVQKFVNKYESALVKGEMAGDSLSVSINDFEDSFYDIINS